MIPSERYIRDLIKFGKQFVLISIATNIAVKKAKVVTPFQLRITEDWEEIFTPKLQVTEDWEETFPARLQITEDWEEKVSYELKIVEDWEESLCVSLRITEDWES